MPAVTQSFNIINWQYNNCYNNCIINDNISSDIQFWYNKLYVTFKIKDWYCYTNLHTHAWTHPTLNSCRYCFLAEGYSLADSLDSQTDTISLVTLSYIYIYIYMCVCVCVCVCVFYHCSLLIYLFNSIPLLCLYFLPQTSS